MGWREAIIALVEPRHVEPQVSQDAERASYIAPPSPIYDNPNAVVPTVTTSTAAQSVAIRTTQDLIASLTSELPINVYTGTRGKQQQLLSTPENLEDPGGDGSGREDWGYRLFGQWLGPGNAFGYAIEHTPLGRVVHYDLFNASQVRVSVVDGAPVWTVNGRAVDVPANFKHWRVNPVAGHVLGLSPIEAHAATIGVSLATTRFGRGWFAEGMHSDGVLAHDGEIGEDGLEVAKRRAMAVRGTREPLVLGGKWAWTGIQITNEESQFLETAGYSEAQCARIYGPGFAEILGYETGSKMTYANVVDRRQDLLVLSMGRWFRRYERLLSTLLPRGQWVEINRDALLESTTLQRYQAHNLALARGWKVINEVREHENLKPVPWGNEPYQVTAADPQPTTQKDSIDGSAAGA